MTKTPDEIKKGLVEAIEEVTWVVDGGSAHDLQDACDMAHASMADALALIQQLESDKQQLEGMLTHMNQLRDAAAGRALKMEERVHQLEAERDALLTFVEKECYYCKRNFSEHPDCPCLECDGDKHWEWRGVQKEE